MSPKKFNQCLQMICAGNMQGFVEIYNEYKQAMIYTSFRIIKIREAAEDIASTFLEYILENANSVKYVENPDAWICLSIKNRAKNYVNRESRLTSFDDFNYPNCKAANIHLKQAFMEILKDLSEDEADLVRLHFLHGYKYREISKFISKPVGTIKRIMHEIKMKLEPLKNIS